MGFIHVIRGFHQRNHSLCFNAISRGKKSHNYLINFHETLREGLETTLLNYAQETENSN